MGFFSKRFPLITAQSSVTVNLSPQEAHDRIAAALVTSDFDHVIDNPDAVFDAQQGDPAILTAAAVNLHTAVRTAMRYIIPFEDLPIRLHVELRDADGVTTIVATAKNYLPSGMVVTPQRGEIHDLWLKACQDAVDKVAASVSTSAE